MKRKMYWSNGAPVEPVDLSDDNSVRDAFSRAVLGKSTPAVRAFWNQMIFAGRGVPPAERRSEVDVLQFVRSTPNSVGYVSATTKVDGVRVLQVGD